MSCAHWTGTAVCPYCGLCDETLYHRLWECPAWQRLRWEVLGGEDVHCLPEGIRAHLVLEEDATLVAARRAAEAAPGLESSTLAVGEVYTDGSAVDPTDAMLRRAAWSAVWWSRRCGRPETTRRRGTAAIAAAATWPPGPTCAGSKPTARWPAAP